MSNEGKTEARKRSPNYPVLSLPKALERAKQLRPDKYNFIPLDALANRWEQKSFNTYTLQIVAALSAFGLVETQGEKEKRKIRLTNDAHKILSDIAVPDRDTLIKELALKPKIFNMVWDFYKNTGLPQDDVLKSELVWEDNFGFSFTEYAADLFINNFKETISFANLTTNVTIEKQIVEEHKEINTNTEFKNFEMPLGDGLTATLVVPYPLSKTKFDLLSKIIKAYEEGIVGDLKKEEQQKIKDMETIFDYDVTQVELERILDKNIDRNDYLQNHPNLNNRLEHLCLLLFFRGDDKWKDYFNQINDNSITAKLIERMNEN